jgi:hypothetical protein
MASLLTKIFNKVSIVIEITDKIASFEMIKKVRGRSPSLKSGNKLGDLFENRKMRLSAGTL